jgi:hypothetical protein
MSTSPNRYPPAIPYCATKFNLVGYLWSFIGGAPHLVARHRPAETLASPDAPLAAGAIDAYGNDRLRPRSVLPATWLLQSLATQAPSIVLGRRSSGRDSNMRVIKSRPIPTLLSIIVVLLGVSLVLSVKAFAAPTQSPHFSTAPVVTQAHFVIPEDSDATWTLNVWLDGQLIGATSGTSGTLSVPLPAAQSCKYQADVRISQTNGTRYYSGNRALSSCCPVSSTSAGGGVTTSVSSS